MILNRTYFRLKPFLPRELRMTVRRWQAKRKLRSCSGTWPIDPAAGTRPEGWPGWSDGKRFALVLTHDVEGGAGVERTQLLSELEESLGFRSSFNFVPEGGYATPVDLRESLRGRGFEVGLHDLRHDGRLYDSRSAFAEHARRINKYLAAWGAEGFRSAYMLRELPWLHDLKIGYDSSTFDTDPFEPQPDGVGTIFPFWIPRHPSSNHGYVEMPYTLPQDSTLFLLFRQTTIDTWKRKLDWIAERGGMALLNTHPDYMRFQHQPACPNTYSAELYREFLDYARTRYGGQFWHPLPREVAAYVKENCRSCPAPGVKRKKVWIDLDNTPHVPFFEPIIEELAARQCAVIVTARDAFQVCELADQKKLSYRKIGKHHGKNKLAKLCGLFYRALQLAPIVLHEKPQLAISHGSRSQLILCNLLRIPSVLLEDYEHANFPILMRPTWTIVPEAVSNDGLLSQRKRIRTYPGIKEDVYVAGLQPDAKILHELAVAPAELIVTVRPPATEAHYHNPESERLFIRFMERACAAPDARVVLLPRNTKQAAQIRRQWPHWFSDRKTVIPEAALDGLNLLWHSDLVVSGGGTMNREAAALGIPVYSIFRGKSGAIDRFLSEQGRLVLIQSAEEVDRRIHITRRKKKPLGELNRAQALPAILSHLETILSAC